MLLHPSVSYGKYIQHPNNNAPTQILILTCLNDDRMFAEPILVSIGQEPDLAHLAQKYIYFCIPFVYMVFVSTAVRKFLQSLGKLPPSCNFTRVPFSFPNCFIDMTHRQNARDHVYVCVVVSTQLPIQSGLAQVYASWLCRCRYAFCHLPYDGVCCLYDLSSWGYQVCPFLLAWLVTTSVAPLETFSETWFV